MLVNGCGGDGGGGNASGSTPLAAACQATLGENGSVSWPAVKTSEGTYQYTLVPAPNGEYVATRQTVDASLTCVPLAFNPDASPLLQADHVARAGQRLSIAFSLDPGSDGTVFTKTAGTVKSGLLGGTAGDGYLPLGGAAVTVTSMAGTVVATGTTNAYGALIVGLENLPDHFRVKATGGTLNGQPFQGSLLADVEDYTTGDLRPSVTLTPVSTLVSAYRQRYPALSLGEAMGQVKTRLGLPENADIDSVDQALSDYFDNGVFYAAAAQSGGVDALVQGVLADWEQGVAHTFPPLVAVNRDAPTPFMKELLDDPSAAQASQSASCGASCMRPQAVMLGLDIVGKLYSVYSAKQNMDFQADVIRKLNILFEEVKLLKTVVGALETKLTGTSYDTAYAKVEPWDKPVIAALEGVRWIATNPEASYKPQYDKCTMPFPNEDDTYEMPAGPCKVYAQWNVKVQSALADIGVLQAKLDGTHPFGSFDPEDATKVKDVGAFQRGLAGTATSDGILRDYRQLIYLSRAGLTVKDQRLFFRPQDSNAIWNHYRYWETVQSFAFLFFADYYETVGKRLKLAELKKRYAQVMDLERQAMPMRVLPANTVIDPFNLYYDGSKVTGAPIGGAAVGGPMMWWTAAEPTACRSLFQSQFTFDAANVTIQSDLRNYLGCVNSTAAGKGLTDWRLGTFREWQAFTLTSGTAKPMAVDPSYTYMSVWMAARGFDMQGFDGQLVYVAAPECTGSIYFNNKYTPCADYRVNFQFVSGQWAPFFVFNGTHSPGRYPEKGSSGWVFLTRPINPGEYW